MDKRTRFLLIVGGIALVAAIVYAVTPASGTVDGSEVVSLTIATPPVYPSLGVTAPESLPLEVSTDTTALFSVMVLPQNLR